MGGAAKKGSSFGATLTGKAALDFFPTASVQRTIVYADDGAIYKDDGAGTGWASLVTGLTTAGVVPFLYEAGAESAGNNRKVIAVDRINSPRVLSGDGASMAAIASPAADWSGSNQPGCGTIHQNFNWMAGNANAPHTLYRSTQANHEDFLTSAYTLRVFPGEGERIVGLLSYKGVLIVWKYPIGVYAIDTSDNTDTNWRPIKVGSPGAAGPRNMVGLEDDLVWVATDATWHLLSATTATGSVRAEDIAARKLGSYHKEQINTSRLQFADMGYYAHKLGVQLACSAAGATAKNRMLILDLNRRTEIGERWIFADRDRNEAFFLRKVSDVLIPAMIDNVGQMWELDQANRNADGSGYTFEAFLRDSDFGEIVPGWQGRYKNLRFIQVEYDGRTSVTLTTEIYLDGDLSQTISLALTAGGATLPATLPFTLGTESMRLTDRRRLVGRGRRIAVRFTNGIVDEDPSLARVLLGLEVGE